MIVEITTKFTDEDKELLRHPLPDDPCEKCDLYQRMACGGCKKGMAYTESIGPFREAGVYEIAKRIRMIDHMENEIRGMVERRNKMMADLPNFLQTGDLVVGWAACKKNLD